MPKGGGPYKLQPTACASQVFLGFPLNKVCLISIFDILLFCFHKYYVWFSFHFFLLLLLVERQAIKCYSHSLGVFAVRFDSILRLKVIQTAK